MRERQPERIIKARRIEAKKTRREEEKKRIEMIMLPSIVITSMLEKKRKKTLVQYSYDARFAYYRR